MIIHNQRSLIAIHNERDREDFIDEKVKDGDVIKTIKTIRTINSIKTRRRQSSW